MIKVYTYRREVVLCGDTPPMFLYITIEYHDYESAAHGLRCLDADLRVVMCELPDNEGAREVVYNDFADHVVSNGCDEEQWLR